MVSRALKEKSEPIDPYGLKRRPHMHCGNPIQWVREAFQLTQAEFGALLEGVSQVNVARYERGQVEPGLDFWRKFARAFGVNLTWAITGGGEPYQGVAWGPEAERMRQTIRKLYGSHLAGRNFDPLRSDSLRAYAGLESLWKELCDQWKRNEEAGSDDLSEFLSEPIEDQGETATEAVEHAASKKPKPRRRRKEA